MKTYKGFTYNPKNNSWNLQRLGYHVHMNNKKQWRINMGVEWFYTAEDAIDDLERNWIESFGRAWEQ